MEQLTTTPFGRRPVTAGLIARAIQQQGGATPPALSATDDPIGVDKWQLLRDLSTARRDFGLSDRTLMVLSALLSFHPEQVLTVDDDLIVFPSNRSLSDRAHGMAESTLRRHLASLVQAGIIHRHDSPNGKRYARRFGTGEIAHAFGFDLTPLLHLADTIANHAQAARAYAAELRLNRERISLLKRDARVLCDFGMTTDDQNDPAKWADRLATIATLDAQMRRKMPLNELVKIKATLEEILAEIQTDLAENPEPISTELSGSDTENERHYQNSNKDSFESESHATRSETNTNGDTAKDHDCIDIDKTTRNASQDLDTPAEAEQTNLILPLSIILTACSEITLYHDGPITSWADFVATASRLHSMMGISPAVWHDAIDAMGHQTAAVTLACMLQRFAEIRNPSGYLRALSTKSRRGDYSSVPAVLALSQASRDKAA